MIPEIDELSYLREQFVEATTLHGRLADFYQIDHIKWKNTDSDIIYKDPVRVSYTLDANPSIKLINRYGWFVNDQAALPVLAYITFTDIDNKPIEIEEQCIIDIQSFINIDGTTKINKFIVQAVSTDLELNQAVLNLVPYKETLKNEVRVLQTKADPELEHKYTKREEIWTDVVSETDQGWKPKIEG